MDRLAIVTIDRRFNRPAVNRVINDAATAVGVYLQRGTLTFSPPPRRTRLVSGADRFAGQWQVGEAFDNAALNGVFSVKGTDEGDAVAKLESFLADLNSALMVDRHIEFRPENLPADHTTYLEIRGAATATPRYARVELNAFLLAVEVSIPIAPLAEGLPSYVREDFTTNPPTQAEWEAEWTYFQGSSANTSISSGDMNFVTAGAGVEHLLAYTARGYQFADNDVSAQWERGVLGTAGAVVICGAAAKIVDADNAVWADVWDDGTAPLLRIVKRVAGATVVMAQTAIVLPALSGDYTVRCRIDGNELVADYWLSGTEIQLGHVPPTNTLAATLAGADATALGAGVVGWGGVYCIPQGSSVIDFAHFVWAPYVYDRDWPATVDLLDVPGDAPAKVELELINDVDVPVFGLVGWIPLPGAPITGSQTPFGVLPFGTGGVEASVSGFVDAALAGASDGTVARHALAAGGGSAGLRVSITPDVLPGDPFGGEQIALEVWACLYLPATVVGLRASLYLEPLDGQPATRHYSLEHQAPGRTLVIPSAGASVRRFTKLGTVLVDHTSRRANRLGFDFTYGAGSSGNLDVDYLVLDLPSRRAHTITGVPNDTAYPALLPIAAQAKSIRHDRRGRIRARNEALNAWAPSPGLGGSRLELEPGDNRVVIKTSDMVPDDPTSQATGEALQTALIAHFIVTPRWRLFRSS